MNYATPFSNLEEITHLVARRRQYRETPPDPHVSVKLIDYADGVLKVCTTVLPNMPRRNAGQKIAVGESREAMAADVLARSARRAAASIRDLCIATRCNRILTFTARGGMDRDECFVAVSHFAQAMRMIGHDLPMIAVPELHLGEGANHGTYHVHAAVRWPGFIDFALLHQTWHAALARASERFRVTDSSPGSVNVSRHANAPLSAAKYLAKYVKKEFELQPGVAYKKRFVCYGPISRPRVTRVVIPASECPPLTSICQAAMNITGADRGMAVDSVWNQTFLVDNVWQKTRESAAGQVPGPAAAQAELTAAHVLAEAAFLACGSGSLPAAFPTPSREEARAEFARSLDLTPEDEPLGELFEAADGGLEEHVSDADLAWHADD